MSLMLLTVRYRRLEDKTPLKASFQAVEQTELRIPHKRKGFLVYVEVCFLMSMVLMVLLAETLLSFVKKHIAMWPSLEMP